MARSPIGAPYLILPLKAVPAPTSGEADEVCGRLVELVESELG